MPWDRDHPGLLWGRGLQTPAEGGAEVPRFR